jgi:hypothetical protein
MIVRHVLAIAIIAATSAAAQAEMIYRGGFKFTKANPSCTEGPGAGENYTAQFHPASAPGNFNFTALNRFFYYSATSYKLSTGSFSNSFKQVTNTSLGWSDFKPDKPSFVLVSKQTPAAIDSNTKSVTLIGQIKNPFGSIGQENCVADFIFSGNLEVQ